MTTGAVDLEEVIADTIRESCNSTDKLDQSDFASWDLTDYTWQVYNGVSDALWRHDPLSIPLVEPTRTMNELYNASSQLDIVTARRHVNDKIEEYLAHHAIPYDNLVSTSKPKYELDYDWYLDDNPEMVGHCRLFLRDHPHNQHIDTSKLKSCTRVHSAREVLEFI